MVSQSGAQAASAPSQTLERAPTLEHEWIEAVTQRDTALLGRILAEGFIITTPFDVITKTQCLEDLSSGALVLDSVSSEDVTLRDYGAEVVVYGTATVKAHYRGHDISGQYQYQYTEGYVKWPGQWQAVNCQARRLCSSKRKERRLL